MPGHVQRTDRHGPARLNNDSTAYAHRCFTEQGIRGTGALPMISDQTTCPARHPDGYAAVIRADELDELAYFARTTCRHKGPARMRRCTHCVLRSLLCPCAWNELCITSAIEQELVRVDARQLPSCPQSGNLRGRVAVAPECFDADPGTAQCERDAWLDRALDEALADTFPASDPVALSVE